MKDLNKKILDPEGHLNEEGISLFAEAMKLKQVRMLSQEIQEHLQNCGFCSARVMDLFEIMEDLNFNNLGSHPILGNAKDLDLALGDNKKNVENVLQQLLDDALEVPLFENMMESQLAYRSTLGDDALQVLFPKKEQLCTQKISFVFNKKIDKSASISISDNSGRKIKKTIPIDTKEFTIDISDVDIFPSGLYYWKLMIKGEKAIVGKVFIIGN